MAERDTPLLQPVDEKVIELARQLIRTARHGALGVIDPDTGAPNVSRVATATDLDGTPLILVSALSRHTGAMLNDPRCSLLVGEPGKGDVLAHPRMTIACRAGQVARNAPPHDRVERRYLARQPKARLYAGFADFSFFKLVPVSASLVGGFARAYKLTPAHLLTESAAIPALEALEPEILDLLNGRHAQLVDVLANRLAGANSPTRWSVTGIDPEGIDLAGGTLTCRFSLAAPLTDIGTADLLVEELRAAISSWIEMEDRAL